MSSNQDSLTNENGSNSGAAISNESDVSFDALLPFQLSDYIFYQKIASGAFSSVYLVKSTKYQEEQRFCAKVLPLFTEDGSCSSAILDEEGNLVESEIAALTSLNHPNIIRMYDFFIGSGKLIIILELCEYGTLDREINMNGRMNEKRFRIIARSLLCALLFCHRKKIAHRDIKPANIFIDKFHRPKLADFGLSSFTIMNTSSVCGSPNYLAPEVIKISNKINHNPSNFINSHVSIDKIEFFDVYKADIYALGVTFYQMVVGELPKDQDHITFPDDILFVKKNCKSSLDLPYLSDEDSKAVGKNEKSMKNDELAQLTRSSQKLVNAGSTNERTNSVNNSCMIGNDHNGTSNIFDAEIRDLIVRMLDKDPAKRPDAAELLNSECLVDNETKIPINTKKINQSLAAGSMMTFGGTPGNPVLRKRKNVGPSTTVIMPSVAPRQQDNAKATQFMKEGRRMSLTFMCGHSGFFSSFKTNQRNSADFSASDTALPFLNST